MGLGGRAGEGGLEEAGLGGRGGGWEGVRVAGVEVGRGGREEPLACSTCMWAHEQTEKQRQNN